MQRDVTIDKLKAATKYNSTQQLLEKYGGAPSPKPSPAQKGTKTKAKSAQQSPGTSGVGRTGIAPPPTANIPGRNGPAMLPSTPQRTPLDTNISPQRQSLPPNSVSPASAAYQSPLSPQTAAAEFAPNAFSAPPQYSSRPDQPRWYDRLMDVLLGEDETLPKNRMALICKHCRLVNGQAPPGIKRPEDLGKWKCGGCGGWNGEENEAKKLVAAMAKRANPVEDAKEDSNDPTRTILKESGTEDDTVMVSTAEDDESDVTQYSESSDHGDEDVEETQPEPPPKPKRGRPKGSTKKSV